MRINILHWIGIGFGLIIIAVSMFFYNTNAFLFVFGIGILVGFFPFIFSVIQETRISNEKEEMFLEFTRNLAESVKTGTPISKSIFNVRNKPFGALSSHVQKLGNQISLGIPLSRALKTFANDVNNKTISRALTLIGQAEKAGGDIGEILESVAEAVNLSDKLKKERKAAISTLVIQGYIIFFIFIIIILVLQFKIIPLVSNISNVDTSFDGGVDSGAGLTGTKAISNSFFYLLLVQSFFSGLAIGKLSEGSLKSGIKHSFALVLASFLISAGANLFMG